MTENLTTMNKHVFLPIMLIFAWLSTLSISAQQDTTLGHIGVHAGVQFTGIDAGGSNVNAFLRGTYYTHANRKGFNMFVIANLQKSNISDSWGYLAVGGGNRFWFNKRPDSFLECGAGIGFQTGFTPTLRTLGYVVSVIPIKKHRLVIFGSADFGFNVLPGSQLQYRYKGFMLYQVTKSSEEDVNLFLGLHAEYDAAIGPTLQVWSPGGNFQIWLACGVNPDRADFHTERKPCFGGAYGITFIY